MLTFAKRQDSGGFFRPLGQLVFLARSASDEGRARRGAAPGACLKARVEAARETLSKQHGLSKPTGATGWNNWMNR